MHPIPAIDIIEGKCVRLTQGDYAQQKVYNEDPLEVAKAYEAHGLRRLHLVDLDGAKAKRIINYKVLERIASKTSLQIDFGGGLKSEEDLRIAFASGAQQVTGGTVAVKAPEVFESWLQRFGPQRIILGSDVKDGKIAISGWQEQSELELFPFLKAYVDKGVHYTICTDVSKDGLLEGTALPLYKAIRAKFPELQLIASGGITSLDELQQLQEIGCYGAIIGKAIYEQRIALRDLEAWMLRS